MKLKCPLTIILTLGVLIGFGQDNRTEVLDEENMSNLMMTCYVCHNPRVKSHADAIAPPLVAVKYMYKMKYENKEDFVDEMTEFVVTPSNREAIMNGAVMRFGVMPEMPMDEEQVRKIAAYIYENEIEEPDWFPEHFEERHGMEWKGQ